MNDYLALSSLKPVRLGVRKFRSNTKQQYPNLKMSKGVLNQNPKAKTSNVEVEANIVKLGSDRRYDDVIKYYYNRREKHYVPISSNKRTLLSFNDYVNKK